MDHPTTEPIDFVTLYRRAFEEFGTSALWSSKPVPDPTPADALAITHSLRVEGNLEARRLAERIERALPCRCLKSKPKSCGLLAVHRDPESYVAGSTPLTRYTARYSNDIDVFHDREERVAHAAQDDTALLEESGYTVEWQRRDPADTYGHSATRRRVDETGMGCRQRFPVFPHDAG